MKTGVFYKDKQSCQFVVWAPCVKDMSVVLMTEPKKNIQMNPQERGYWQAEVTDVMPNALYMYHSSSFGDKPDPTSYFQPQGVHGPSQVMDHADYTWHDQQWKGLPLDAMIIYEMHVGTFTHEGTFDAAISKIDYLSKLGVNMVEVMPIAQFPGRRNWGYDGVYPYAVQNSYGGVSGFKRFVDACHQRGLAVTLDVVYNHLGPEGNYLGCFGPYFTDKYKTPWGLAINYDDAYSDHVKDYFINNALYWFEHFHIDALRLDAVHAICDQSAQPFLKELAQRVRELSVSLQRPLLLIAESDLNNKILIDDDAHGGYSLDAQWADDFHHALHGWLAQERHGYYEDFGYFNHIVKTLTHAYVYDGQYSTFRKRRHGNKVSHINPAKFVVSIQNHDQVGNRMLGERLSQLVSIEALKTAAGLMLFSPYVPLLFMGEEYGEDNPFLYFVDHSDQALIKAVREGRKNEFEAFHAKGEAPDPQDIATYNASKLDWNKVDQGSYAMLLRYYQTLIQLRKESLALQNPKRSTMEIMASDEKNTLLFSRSNGQHTILSIIHLGNAVQTIEQFPKGRGYKIFDSMDAQWDGNGKTLPDEIKNEHAIKVEPLSFALYRWEK